MAENNIVYAKRKELAISEIWTSQHPFMHSWLVVSFVGLVVLYLAMSFTMV